MSSTWVERRQIRQRNALQLELTPCILASSVRHISLIAVVSILGDDGWQSSVHHGVADLIESWRQSFEVHCRSLVRKRIQELVDQRGCLVCCIWSTTIRSYG